MKVTEPIEVCRMQDIKDKTLEKYDFVCKVKYMCKQWCFEFKTKIPGEFE